MKAKSAALQKHKIELSGFILERTAKRMKQSFKQALNVAEAGITVDQWVILQELEKEDGLSQFEIAERTFKDAPTVTRIIDLLCEKQLTERRSDPNDRRRFSINLTTVGQEKIDQVLPVVQAFREKAWHGLKDKELNQLSALLNNIFNNLT